MRWAHLGAILVLAQQATAETGDADRLADEAQAAAKNGDFVGAAGKFLAAYKSDPRPDLICNVGIAYQKAKEWPRAQLFLGQCLLRATSLDAKLVAQVRTVLASVEDKLRAGDYTPIDVVVDPEGATVGVKSFAADETFVGSRLIWLPYGTQELTISADGRVAQTRTVEATSHAQRTLRVVLDRTPPPPHEPGSGSGSGSQVVQHPPPPLPPSPPPPPPSHPSLIWPIASGVAAIGLGAFALVSYSDAGDHATLANQQRTGEEYQVEADAATSAQHRAWALGAAAGVATAASVYLWMRYVRAPHAHVEVNATGSGASVSLSGAW